MILPFAILAIVLVPTPGPERRALRAGTVSAVSIGTFLLIMLPAIRRLNRWRVGVHSELTHSIQGHDVPLPLRVTWGLFHLRESLWPGIGMPLLALGLLGLAAPFVAARERRMPLILIATFAVVWYAVHEATPLKPFPDFPRYMLPLVPLLLILGASFIYELAARWDRRGILAAIVLVLAAVPALMMSVRINAPDVDPRGVVPAIVAASGGRVIFDRYSDYERKRRILGISFRPTKDMADIVVTSNLAYDRFALDAAPGADGGAIIARSRHARISTCRTAGRPWATSIQWCALLPWTDRWMRLNTIAAEIRAGGAELDGAADRAAAEKQ